MLILAAALIDGTGAEPSRDIAVLLDGERITRVLPQRDLERTAREGREVLDLGDATLLPGLIDTHVHLTFSAAPTHEEVRRAVTEESDATLALRAIGNAQAHLAGGVTTVRDVGGRGFVALAVRDAVAAGIVLGPRILASGPAITTRTGHLNYLGAVADDAEEVRMRVAEVLDAGADLVKICATGGIMTAESDPMQSQYTAEELRAAVEVAEARGKLVAAHVLTTDGVERCVEAGVRSLEHCLFQEAPGEYRFRPELAERMRDRGIFAGLTYAGITQARYRREVLGEAVGELGIWQERLMRRGAAERALIDAGVRYVLHSDCGVRETPFGEFWRVLASACYELSLSPLEAIRAATGTAAELLGLGAELGSVAPGKRADLLAVSGRPEERIKALARPGMVMRDGRVVSRERDGGGSLRAPFCPERRA
ncbi:MAG: amidohydrolase family protein [Armatimonadota bacterium]